MTNSQFSVKILSVFWLLVLAILGVYSIASSVWWHTHLPFIKVPINNRETVNVETYIYGNTPSISLGEIKNSDNAYVHIKLRFRADSTEGYPNVFQTAPGNRGMRMEISGSTAAIIVPGFFEPRLKEFKGIRGLILTTTLNKGQRYELEVEALNGMFVHAKLNGHLVVDYYSAGLSMEISQLLVGGGFDESRAFRGQIDNISVTIGKKIFSNQAHLYIFYVVFLIGLLAVLVNLPGTTKEIVSKVKILLYLDHIDWTAFISMALIISFCTTLCTVYFFPIYPDEIQVRFWLSRLPYDFPEIINGAPTCLSSFFQHRPLTMYLPGLIDWMVHGRLERIPELRQVGFIVAFTWVAGLAFYLNARVKNIQFQVENQLSFSLRALYIVGFIIAIFSVGVFPFFLVTNRGEQLILPAVVLLIAIFLISKHMGHKGHWVKNVVLIVLYFVGASLILYGHAKGLFLTPFIIIVGWQICSHFRSRLPFILAMILLVIHIVQDISALKYAFQCSEMPHYEAMLKSFSIDPASLFYDPRHFFDQVFQSLIRLPKYLHQLGFQEQTDIAYLPGLPLATSAKYANIFVKLNLTVAFFTMMIALPCRYYRKDVATNRFFTVNLVLLALFVCALISAIFNLPKNWYDAGYLYALLLIIIIFFIGENFSKVFQKTAARKFFLYLGAVALLSQAVFIHRNLPAFMAGYAGPGVSIAKYDSIKTRNELTAASRACNIDPVRSKKVVVDDYTYLYFRKSKWPMAITYIGFLNDDKSVRQFFLEADSDGLVIHCESWIFNKPYILPFVKREGEICCISKDDLKKLPSLP